MGCPRLPRVRGHDGVAVVRAARNARPCVRGPSGPRFDAAASSAPRGKRA
jgi:hypothetical protein